MMVLFLFWILVGHLVWLYLLKSSSPDLYCDLVAMLILWVAGPASLLFFYDVQEDEYRKWQDGD